jgi:hypothetical protein
VVGNQRPCIAQGFRIQEDFSLSIEKVIPVLVVSEYSTPFNTTDHDVVQGSGSIDSGFPRHETSLSPCPMSRQLKNLTASRLLLQRPVYY